MPTAKSAAWPCASTHWAAAAWAWTLWMTGSRPLRAYRLFVIRGGGPSRLAYFDEKVESVPGESFGIPWWADLLLRQYEVESPVQGA